MLKQFTTLAVGQRISLRDTPYTIVGSVIYDGKRYEETHNGTDSGPIHYIERILKETIGGTKRYLGESVSERHDDGETGYDYELELTAAKPLDAITIETITPTHIEWINANGRKQKTIIRETEVVTVSYVSGEHDDSIIGETLQTFYIKDDPAHEIISIDREGANNTDTYIAYDTISLGLNYPFVDISRSNATGRNTTYTSDAYRNYAHNNSDTYPYTTHEQNGLTTRISRIIMAIIRIWVLVITLGKSLISRGPRCAKYRQPPYTQSTSSITMSGSRYTYTGGSARSYYYPSSYSHPSIPWYCQTSNGSSGSSRSGRSGYSGK